MDYFVCSLSDEVRSSRTFLVTSSIATKAKHFHFVSAGLLNVEVVFVLKFFIVVTRVMQFRSEADCLHFAIEFLLAKNSDGGVTYLVQP
jgi:hypothetical protein